MFNQDEGKIECGVGNMEICFWQGKRLFLILFLTSGFAVFICLWLLYCQMQTTRLMMFLVENKSKVQCSHQFVPILRILYCEFEQPLVLQTKYRITRYIFIRVLVPIKDPCNWSDSGVWNHSGGGRGQS